MVFVQFLSESNYGIFEFVPRDTIPRTIPCFSRKKSLLNVEFGRISKQEILRFSDVILINGIEEDKARIRLSFDSFLCNKKKYRKLEPSIVKKFYNSIIFMHKIWIYESLKTSIPSFKKLKILNLIYFLEKVNQKR